MSKLVIGLTGGIGSGKSTVADLFHALGVVIIDTDVIARVVVEPHTDAYKAIVTHFGPEITTSSGLLDRAALRQRIFADTKAKTWLEQLLHPLIRAETAQQTATATSSYCIIVIPLLFETLPNPLINRILVVDAAVDLQIARTVQRDQASSQQVQAIINTQVDRETRLAKAHDVIYNDNVTTDLIPQVEKLHQFYLSLCERSGNSH